MAPLLLPILELADIYFSYFSFSYKKNEIILKSWNCDILITPK